MGKAARNHERVAPAIEGSWSLSPGTMLGTIVVGVVMLLVLTFLNWDLSRQIQARLDDRFAKIENQLAQLSTNSARAAAAAPAQRGPDPNRVYTVKTDAAPVRGSSSAPITIAEFSDFQ